MQKVKKRLIPRTALTKWQEKRYRRDSALVAEFDEYEGSIGAIVKKLSTKHKLSVNQVRNILKDANRIGRNRE